MKCSKAIEDFVANLGCDIRDCKTEDEVCDKILGAMDITLGPGEFVDLACIEEMIDGRGDDE